MLFSWLSKFVASLLVSVLFGATLSVVLDQTVLSSHYLEGQLASTNSYERLSGALTDQVAQKSGSADPAIKAKLQTILTPQTLQLKITSALDQLQAYYKGNGPPPVIDLSDLAGQAQAAGVPVGTDSGIDKPITLKGNDNVKGVSKTFKNVKLATLVAAAILAIALIALSWQRHRYAPLANVLISLGVMLGLLAVFFSFAPDVIANHVKADFDSNAFASLGRDLATAISHDLGKRFGIIALACLAIGIAARVWIARRHHVPATPSVAPPVSAARPASDVTKKTSRRP